MMIIELHTAPILQEIRQKSHLEVQDIKDSELRDNARAGLDKIDEIERCMMDGFAQVSRRCWRFLADDYTVHADDAKGESDVYVYDFLLSERRGANKTEPLTNAMHSLVVQYALAKFYATVNQAELSNKHSLLAIEAGNTIEELLYNKKPPRV